MKLATILTIMITFSILFGCKDGDKDTIINNYYSEDDYEVSQNPNIKPKVIFTNPLNGSIGPEYEYFYLGQSSFKPKITFQFNKLMDFKKLSKRQITVESEGQQYYFEYGPLNSASLNILVLELDSYYLGDQEYKITLDSSICDIHGNSIGKNYILKYIPEPNFRVYNIYPNIGTIPVLVNNLIALRLNSNVNKSFTDQITFNPTIKGQWKYPQYYPGDSSMIYFNTTDTLKYNTKYSLEIGSAATNSKGLQIKAPILHIFETDPLLVSHWGSSSQTGPNGYWVYTRLDFLINGYVDTSSIRASVSITPKLPFTISAYPYGQSTTVYIYLDMALQENNKKYTLKFSKSLREKGGAFLLKDYYYDFFVGN